MASRYEVEPGVGTKTRPTVAPGVPRNIRIVVPAGAADHVHRTPGPDTFWHRRSIGGTTIRGSVLVVESGVVDVDAEVVRAEVVRAEVVGAEVVGAEVVGAEVVGAEVVGAVTVDVGPRPVVGSLNKPVDEEGTTSAGSVVDEVDEATGTTATTLVVDVPGDGNESAVTITPGMVFEISRSPSIANEATAVGAAKVGPTDVSDGDAAPR